MEPIDVAGENTGILTAESCKSLSWGGPTYRNITGRISHTSTSGVGQHAGTVDQLAQEWWVNIGRNQQFNIGLFEKMLLGEGCDIAH